MTTRDQARRIGRTGRTAAPSADPAPIGPSLPERLLAARERKGVDLYRAERDTKIRARYLSALEHGEFRELPGTVYTKGFLRNYAMYLGLDPDDVLQQWRRERGDVVEPPPMVVPRPLTAPRQGLTFTPGVFVAALLTVLVLAFLAYLGLQLFRFNQAPTIAVTDPATAVTTVDETATSYTLRGTTIPGGTVVIDAPGQETQRVTADATGHWSADVPLRKGRNQFDISATDPATLRTSTQTAELYITVPFSTVQAPTLTVDSPADGATFANGAIPVQGSATNATTVTITATYEGPPGSATPAPSGPGFSPGASGGAASPAATAPATPRPTLRATPRPTPAATPTPAGSAAAPSGSGTTPSSAPSGSPGPSPVTASVGSDGSFTAAVELTAGRWLLTITAATAQGTTTTITRTVTVVYKGVNLVVSVKGGAAWLKVWVDGQVDATLGAAGKVLSSGATMTFNAQSSVEVRTGSSGFTYFTLNGTSLGHLGQPGVPETWLFAPPAAPQLTQRK